LEISPSVSLPFLALSVQVWADDNTTLQQQQQQQRKLRLMAPPSVTKQPSVQTPLLLRAIYCSLPQPRAAASTSCWCLA
jgi:hypothetical protein